MMEHKKDSPAIKFLTSEYVCLDSVADLCHECGKALGKNPLYFEVNTGWEIIVPGSDAENSQGCFPIGSTCANKFAPELLIKMGAK